MIRLSRVFAVVGFLALSSCQTYAPEWPLRHGDIGNTDFVGYYGARQYQPAWFFGPNVPIGTFVAIGGNGLVYTHSYNRESEPQGENAGCRLWALDAETGEVAWCNAEVSEAVTSIGISPNNQIILSDGRFLWSFSPDGAVNWKTPVDDETSSITFLSQGFILVADYGGALRAYNPIDGRLVSSQFRLNAAPNPVGEFANTEAPGLLKTGVSREYSSTLISNFFGYRQVIQDMPLVHPETGLIYISANGETSAEGRLWALKFDPPKSGEPGTFSVVCAGAMGPSSDTSPAISTDMRRVYAASAGVFYAFSDSDCKEVWRVDRPGFSASSPTVSSDGLVYLMASLRVDAYEDLGSDIEAVWTLTGSDVAAQFGVEDAVFDSVVLGTNDYVYVTISLGKLAQGYIVPVAHRLLVIDRMSGEIVSSSLLGEESDSTPSMSANGWIYVPTKALSRGHAISMRIEGAETEETSQIPISRPQTGVYAFRPIE